MKIEHQQVEREGRVASASDRGRVRRAIGRVGAVLLIAASMWMGSSLAGAQARALSPAGIYREAAPSVVVIFGLGRGASGNSGTGTVLTSDGLVLTNDHVISDEKSGRLYRNLIVYFKPNPITGDNSQDLKTAYLVDVVARDSRLDLALLRVKNPPGNLRPIVVGNSDEVEVGEPVAAIGHPGGGGLWTLTTGTVSSKRRDRSIEIFQTDTAINPGNSGGPLLDEHGRLVGINTFVRRVNEKGLPLEGLNYSLRSRSAVAWVNRQTGARIPEISRTRSVVSPSRSAAVKPNKRPKASADRGLPGLLPGSLTAVPPRAGAAPTALVPDSQRSKTPSRKERTRAEPSVRRDEAPPEPGFRRFRGPRGETLYGVPNPEVGLRDTLRQARRGYRALTERADDSLDEMEERLDQYENF